MNPNNFGGFGLFANVGSLTPTLVFFVYFQYTCTHDIHTAKYPLYAVFVLSYIVPTKIAVKRISYANRVAAAVSTKPQRSIHFKLISNSNRRKFLDAVGYI